MIMWNGFSHDKRVPIVITIEYDEDLEVYIVEVTRGTKRIASTFEPSHEPKDELMHISDLERSVKIADGLVKELKKTTRRKK